LGSLELAVNVTSAFQLSTTWLTGEVDPFGLKAGLVAMHATPTSQVAVVVVPVRPRTLAVLDGKNCSTGLPFRSPFEPGASGP